MSMIEHNLTQLGITLPTPLAPVANYVPYVQSGNLIYISGQICAGAGGTIADAHKGKLGGSVSDEAGREAARLCVINILAQLKAAVGDFSNVKRCIRLGGFINSMPDYAALAPIMNGASDLMVEVMGEAGRHARSTVGVAELPLDCAVEVEAIFEVA
ncbi:MAG: RidA family protein [Sphingobium sp.]|nr:RidA family protein [Sphingobium sp.]